MKDVLIERRLFGLIFCGEHIEVSFGDASANVVFVQFRKQDVEFFVSFFETLEFFALSFCLGILSKLSSQGYAGCEFGFVASREGRPVLQAGKDVGVEDIIADIVHGALMRSLYVFSATIVAIGSVALWLGGIGKGPSTISAFY